MGNDVNARDQPAVSAGGEQAAHASDSPELEAAMVHHRAGRLVEAEAAYRQILKDNPDDPSACYLLGVICCQTRNFQQSLEFSDRALQSQPGIALIWSNRGIAFQGLGRDAEAIESFTRAISLKLDFIESFAGRAQSLFAEGRFAEAVSDCDAALALEPGLAEVSNCRGNALHAMKREDEALEAYTAAIRIRANYAEAWCNLGIVLYAVGRYEASVESCKQAILLRPELAEAYFSLGNAQRSLGQNIEALQNYHQAIRLKPDYTEAYVNQGIALEDLACPEEAFASYERAILLDEKNAVVWNNRGSLLYRAMRYAEALDSFDKALAIDPDCAETHNNRASALLVLCHYAAALECCDGALQRDPTCEWVRGTRLYIRRVMCDWPRIEAETQEVEAAVLRGESAVGAFMALALCDAPVVHKRAAEIYVQDRFPAQHAGVTFLRDETRSKIRVGYFSTEFREHATSYLMAEVFERHDRERFEVYGFSYGPDSVDAMTARVSSAMHQFIDVRRMTDVQVAQRAREIGLDIAVDLKGLTGESRTGIFACRAAPIQVNYLGYPGTMGADYIDYVIADHTIIPPESQNDYSEKIVWLPNSYQPNDSGRAISDRQWTRTMANLPQSGFVFCCFNQPIKIGPDVFDLWMRIMDQVPGSVLWLLEHNPWSTENLRKEAVQRGIEGDRIVFSQVIPLADHLARLRLADIVLDTFPYGAHTTASDALWAGVPVLTRMGKSFASRVSGSLLRAVGLEEMIASTQAEYEQRAIALALDPTALQKIRNKLAENRATSPLFNGAMTAQHLEAAYTAMHRQRMRGSEPENIDLTLQQRQT